MNEVTIKLTRKQFLKLIDILWETTDEGPAGEGWASKELQELRDIVEGCSL